MSEQPASGATSLRWIVIAAIAAVAVGALLIWGFFEGREEATAEAQREQPVKAAVEVSHSNTGVPTITLSPDLQKQADIEVLLPTAAPYQRKVEAYGSVLDMRAFTDLSNAIANAKAQLAIAEAKLAASQAAFQRAEVLHKEGQNFSTAQLQAAEATYRSDVATVRAAEIQTQNAAASAYQAWGPVLRQSLTDGTALATDLVQHKRVLVQVTLPLGIPLRQAPQSASIETTTGQRIRIDLVSPATRTDPKIQGVSFFYTADATSGALAGMNVVAYLPVGQPAHGIDVPASAVVWLQGRAWVYLESAENAFTRREIPTTEPQPGGGYVVPAISATPSASGEALASDDAVAGLPTEPLVVKGAQALLSQEFSAQIQVGGD